MIANNEIVEKYVINNEIYYRGFTYKILIFLWTFLPIGYILYSAAVLNKSLYIHILLLTITYFFDNLGFMVGHMNVHKNFMNAGIDYVFAEKNFNQFTYIAYLHHYYNPFILSMVPKEFLLIYLGSTASNKKNNLFTNKIKSKLFIFFVLYFIIICSAGAQIFSNNIQVPTWAWCFINILNIIVTNVSGLGRISMWYTFTFIFYAFTRNLQISFLFLSYIAFSTFLQAVSHSWYHTPNKKKYAYFGIFTYYLGCMLESIGIFDVYKHHMHHKHMIQNMETVEKFENMSMPNFVVELFDNIWDSIHDKKYFNLYYNLLNVIYIILYVVAIYFISFILML